jgi:hypothetical protein
MTRPEITAIFELNKYSSKIVVEKCTLYLSIFSADIRGPFPNVKRSMIFSGYA